MSVCITALNVPYSGKIHDLRVDNSHLCIDINDFTIEPNIYSRENEKILTSRKLPTIRYTHLCTVCVVCNHTCVLFTYYYVAVFVYCQLGTVSVYLRTCQVFLYSAVLCSRV